MVFILTDHLDADLRWNLNRASHDLDCSDRCQTFSTETNLTRTTDHARLSLKIHHFILRRVPI